MSSSENTGRTEEQTLVKYTHKSGLKMLFLFKQKFREQTVLMNQNF